eukprot:jgi/Astpho2/2271/Aster-x0518
MPRRKAPVDPAPDDPVDDGTEGSEADGLSVYNQQVHSLLNQLEAEVQARVDALHRMAEDAAASLRNELKVQLVKIPKQARVMRLVEFQERYAGDLVGPALEEIQARRRALQGQLMPPPGAAIGAGRPRGGGSATVAMTTRKRKAVAALDGSTEEPATQLRRTGRARTAAAVAQTPAGDGVGASTSESQVVLNTRLPGGGMLNTPMPAGWNGASFGGAFATVIRRNAGRGAKTKAGNAIVVTCKDGTQVAVDVLDGMNKVPADKLKEVAEQLEQLKSLATAALR